MLTKMFVKVQLHLADDTGATAIEYGLLLLVAVGVAAAIKPVRDAVITLFGNVTTALTTP